MNKDKKKYFASGLLVINLIFGYIGYSFKADLFEPVFMTMVGLNLLLFLYLIFSKPEQTEWVCQKCQAKLIRQQIRFGLCPYCSTKVKDFRGRSPYTWI